MNTTEMLTELSITFPWLWTRPLAEFGKSYAGSPGVWTGADAPHVMPDGEPMFSTTGAAHEAFDAWLAARGWRPEWYDADTYFLTPGADQ